MYQVNLIIGFTNIIVGLILIALFTPLKRGKVKMNKFYGIKIKKSFESEKNWYDINKYGANRFIIWSIPLIIIGVFTFFIPLYENSIQFWIFLFAPLIIIIPLIEVLNYAKKL